MLNLPNRFIFSLPVSFSFRSDTWESACKTLESYLITRGLRLWVPLTVNPKFKDPQHTTWFTLYLKLGLSATPRVWTREESYQALGLHTARYYDVVWVLFGTRKAGDATDPQNCPKVFVEDVTGGVPGLDCNLPSNVNNLNDPAAFLAKVAKTPRNVQLAVFKGIYWPMQLRSGDKLPPPSSSSSSSSFPLPPPDSGSDADSDLSDADSDFSDADTDDDPFSSSSSSSSSSSDSSSSDDDDDDGDGDGDELPDAPPPSSSSSDDPFTLITTTLAANDPALGLRVLLHLFKLSAVLVLLLASPESLKVVLSLILSSSAYQTSKHLYTVAKNKRRQLWVKIPLMGSDTKLGRVRTDKLPWDGILQGLGCGDVHEAAKRCVLSRDPSGAATRAGRRRATGASGMGAKLRGGGARRLGASTGDQRQGKPGGAGGESGRGYVLMYPLLRCNII